LLSISLWSCYVAVYTHDTW